MLRLHINGRMTQWAAVMLVVVLSLAACQTAAPADSAPGASRRRTDRDRGRAVPDSAPYLNGRS